jgi:hypothetical protein
MELSTKINGYKVELDTDMGDGASGCWISLGSYSASLECADATGNLQGGDDERPIPASTVKAIRSWAEKNGY